MRHTNKFKGAKKTYIGTKEIEAEPMMKNGLDGYKVVYKDGYESWSPKAVFDEVYHEVHAMTFGDAIHMMKDGKKVQRKGWNGKGMFLYLVPADSYEAKTEAGKSIAENGKVKYGAYIAMKTATGEVVPWLASQTDMLAEDWRIID